MCKNICIHKYRPIFTYICVRIQVQIYDIYMYINMYIYIYIYICIYACIPGFLQCELSVLVFTV